MPSVLAIVSKAVFEKMAPKDVKPGHVLETDRYVSSQQVFAQVGKEDAIFLVTVRPPNEALWLVAILDSVKRKGDAWVGSANKTAIKDITPLIKKLEFSTGTGIKAKKGALGMSLQTPRLLTANDVALLRGDTSSAAVAEYRTQVDLTPAARKAKAQAKAAAREGEVLRLVNYRRPFEMLDELAKPQQKQVAKLTRQNRAGKPADLVDDENWAPMELVDVLDVASNTVTHQLYIMPWGGGELFVNDTTKRAAVIIQHGFDQEVYDLAFRKALAAAYASAKPQLAETVDFRLDEPPPVPPDQAEAEDEKKIAAAYKRLVTTLGKSKERYRLFEDLTKLQQETVRDVLRTTHEGLAQHDLSALGLPPYNRLSSWSDPKPPSPLEMKAGKWPVWKWLKESSAGKVKDADAIASITKTLSRDQILELGRIACDDFFDYDFWGEDLKYKRGESVANRHQAHLIRLLAAIIDAAGDDAALAFAEAAHKHLKKEVEGGLAAVASFAVAARARRKNEPYPKKFFSLATDADFLNHGAHLREAIRDVVETMTPSDREKFVVGDNGPHFTTSYDDEVKGGKEVEVPCLLHAWLLVDLAPTDKVVKAMVDSILVWDHDKKPTQQVLDILCKVGPQALLHLQKAVKKKSPYKNVLERALKLVEKGT